MLWGAEEFLYSPRFQSELAYSGHGPSPRSIDPSAGCYFHPRGKSLDSPQKSIEIKCLIYSINLKLFPLQTLSLEFMDEGVLANDEAHHLNEEESSAEVPAMITGYTRDTIAHFSPRKADAGFRQQWERVPLQKVDVIKRR